MWYSFLPTSVNRTFINTFIPLFELIISGFFVIQTFFCLNFLANSGCQYFCQFLSDFLRKASLVDFIQFLQLGVTLFNLRRYFLSLFDLALKQLFCICKSILCYVNSTSAWVILYDRYWTSSALSVGAYDFSWILRIYLIFDLLGELGSSWGSGYWGCWGGWGSVYAIIKLIYSQWIIKNWSSSSSQWNHYTKLPQFLNFIFASTIVYSVLTQLNIFLLLRRLLSVNLKKLIYYFDGKVILS